MSQCSGRAFAIAWLLLLALPQAAQGRRVARVADVEVQCVDCPEYVELSAQDKQQVIWQKLISDEYDGALPIDFPDIVTVNFHDLKNVAWNGTMSYTFDRFSDENPTNHAKVIHTFGSVANIRLEPVPNNLGLTGFFKEGGEYGLIRLSIVADWTKPCKGGTDLNFKGCFKPSLAVKMLRDGDFSSNLLAQPNLGDGVGRDFNYFNHNQATWLPQPGGLGAVVVKKLFSYAANKDDIGGVGLMELGSEGSKADQSPDVINAPRVLYFVPHDAVRGRDYSFSSEEHDVREDFAKIAAGTTLYDVVAPNSHTDCLVKHTFPFHFTDPVAAGDLSQGTCPHTVVARVVTTSRFVSSAWGDQRLFFQHERMGKGGKWKRQPCVRGEGTIPSTGAYRMANDLKRTCTQKCMDGTQPDSDNSVCPFAKLDFEPVQ